MKKVQFIFLLCFLVNSIVSGMGVSYIYVSEYSNDKSIEIENIEDFENIIKNNKINSLYRYGSMNEKTIPQNIKLLLVTDNAWYVFNSSGYQTIIDYQNRVKLGFDYGPDYYFCVEIGIDNFEEYSNLNQHLFLTNVDYSDAVDLGITELFKGEIFPELQEEYPDLYPNPLEQSQAGRFPGQQTENSSEIIKEFKFLLPEKMDKEKYDKWLSKVDKWFTYMSDKPLRESYGSIENPEFPEQVNRPVGANKGKSDVQSIVDK
jgi:hypothetical protein